MGRVISFSEFGKYFSEQSKDFCRGTILDTTILISMTWDVKQDQDEVVEFLDEWIFGKDFRTFATVTTRSEYLNFFRRLLMTEGLRDAADSASQIKLAQGTKAAIKTVSGRLSQREHRGHDPVFNDSDLKEIKQAFSAGPHSGKSGWLAICEGFLKSKLKDADQNLRDLGIEYISPYNEEGAEFFSGKMSWDDGISIAENSALGFSDAMILNALQSSRFSFVVSSDFDLGYAVLSSHELKDVIMPDKLASKYRHFHFPSAE